MTYRRFSQLLVSFRRYITDDIFYAAIENPAQIIQSLGGNVHIMLQTVQCAVG